MPVNPEVLRELINRYGIDKIRSAKDRVSARREQKMFDRVSEKIADKRLPGEIKDDFLVPMEQEIMSYTDAGDPMQMYEAGQMIANGDVVPGATMAALTLAPQAIAKPISKAIQKGTKSVKRAKDLYEYGKLQNLQYDWDWPSHRALARPRDVDLSIRPLHTKFVQVLEDTQINDAVERAILKGGERADFDLVSQRLGEDAAGYNAAARSVANSLGIANGYTYPEFVEYIYRTGKEPNESAIRDFADVQRSAVRGVVANDPSKVQTFLTSPGARVGGGDRLGSKGGVYTSNSYGIADKFSRPLHGRGDGVIGRIQFPTSAEYSGSLRSQLDNIHRDTFNYDDVLAGLPDDVYVSFEDVSDAAKKAGYISGESRYSTRAGDKLPVMEKVYLGNTPLSLQETIYKNASDNANIGGRWGFGEQKVYTEDDSMFIPHFTTESDASKLSDLYRSLGSTETDWNTVNDIVNDYVSKGKTATDIANKSIFTKVGKHREDILNGAGVVAGVGLPAAGLIFGVKETRKKNDWMGDNQRGLLDSYYGDAYPPKNPDGTVDVEKALDMYQGAEKYLNAAYRDFKKSEKREDGGFIRDYRTGGPIHIKPSHRGRFTALLKRTGKPASWFKAHGTPAQKKMATFALNARKWKHADGGLLDVYDDGTMLQYPDGGRIRGRRNGKYFVTELGNKKEQQFQDWYAEAAANLGLDPNPDAYEQAYDYRGYWLNNRDADISSPGFHFPDTWKQPQHPTFSNESVYAKGIDGVGHWDGDKFIPGYFNNVMMATALKRPAVVEEAQSSPYAPSEDILNYIKDIESFRDQWYQDGNGVWTIGYGFTGDDVRKRFPNGMTRAEADQYFADTVSRRVPMFISATPNFDKLNQNQRDALFSYYYNIGHGGYTRKSPTMQKALTDFDLDTVRENIDFGYNDRKNRGLRKRRDYERNLFATPMDYGGILNRLRSVYGDNESIKAAILRAKNVKK